MFMVEEQELFRGGLRTVFENAGLSIVGEYRSAAAALEDQENTEEPQPGTVVLCSLTLDGWRELVHRMLLRAPGCPILGVVDAITEEVVMEAMMHGIQSCIDRTLPADQWVERIRNVYDGKISAAQTVVSHPGTARRALMILSEPLDPTGLNPMAPVLSHRERLVLENVAEGVSLDMAAERMGTQEQALHETLESACRKLVERHRLSGVLEQLR